MREELRAALRSWLAALAWFYPCYLAASFALYAAPALVRVAARGEKLEMFQVGWMNVSATSSASEEVRRPRTPRWPLAVGLGGLVAWAGWRRPGAGLALAALGQAAFLPMAQRTLFRRQWTPEAVLPTALLLLLVGCGLRWITTAERLWVRWLGVLIVFVLPYMLLLALVRMPARSLPLLVPGLVAGLVAGLWRTARPPSPGWRWMVSGAVATGALLGAVRWAVPVVDQARRQARRATLESAPPIPAGLPFPPLPFQKGVNFTAEFPDVYGSEGSRRTLEMLPRYGVKAVALVPYGFAPPSEPRITIPGARGSWESDDGVEYVSRVAHQLGIAVLLKPQLWVGGGSYPGELDFPAPPARAAWFAQYRLFLEHYARLATRIHADVFCIGVELAKMTRHQAEWRQLIARVRELYPGPLVYAASWGPEFESAAFWDALDYIGLNNYYPLPDDLSAAGVVAKVEAVQRRFQRPVIFTEAGFSSYEGPHREPWSETPRRLAHDEQARCYEAVFQAFYAQPWFQGVYWWKVGTNRGGGPQDGSHTPWGKPAMQVIARWYRGPLR